MSDAWWAKKLGGAPAQAPQQAQPSYPQGPQPPAHVPPVPQGSYPQVTGDNIAQAAALWKGGKATKTETAKCPHCGGDNYFSMSNGESAGGAGARLMTQNGAVTTSPRCWNCGYNSAFGLQTGSM
jgi:predicted nucleic-acid-binding Zn-ribbon protein